MRYFDRARLDRAFEPRSIAVVGDKGSSGYGWLRRFKGFDAPKIAKIQTDLADQICDATGGPCAYLGRDMKTVHKGMNITEAEWSATVEDLVKTLNKFKVPAKEQQELLAIIGPMKKDIVGQ